MCAWFLSQSSVAGDENAGSSSGNMRDAPWHMSQSLLADEEIMRSPRRYSALSPFSSPAKSVLSISRMGSLAGTNLFRIASLMDAASFVPGSPSSSSRAAPRVGASASASASAADAGDGAASGAAPLDALMHTSLIPTDLSGQFEDADQPSSSVAASVAAPAPTDHRNGALVPACDDHPLADMHPECEDEAAARGSGSCHDESGSSTDTDTDDDEDEDEDDDEDEDEDNSSSCSNYSGLSYKPLRRGRQRGDAERRVTALRRAVEAVFDEHDQRRHRRRYKRSKIRPSNYDRNHPTGLAWGCAHQGCQWRGASESGAARHRAACAVGRQRDAIVGVRCNIDNCYHTTQTRVFKSLLYFWKHAAQHHNLSFHDVHDPRLLVVEADLAQQIDDYNRRFPSVDCNDYIDDTKRECTFPGCPTICKDAKSIRKHAFVTHITSVGCWAGTPGCRRKFRTYEEARRHVVEECAADLFHGAGQPESGAVASAPGETHGESHGEARALDVDDFLA